MTYGLTWCERYDDEMFGQVNGDERERERKQRERSKGLATYKGKESTRACLILDSLFGYWNSTS